MNVRGELTASVVGCLAGAGLALYAARHTWAVAVTTRRPPLSPLRETRSGADLEPWLPAVALVAAAAAVALLATRGRPRLVVAGVIVGCGLLLAAGAGYGVAVAGRGAWTVVDAGVWPVACLLGGLVAAFAGTLALLRSGTWPSMGARYERGAPPTTARPRDPAHLWDAIDAGADPTDDTSGAGSGPHPPTPR